MFECSKEMLIQLIDYIPVYFAIYVIFDFVGSLLFRKDY